MKSSRHIPIVISLKSRAILLICNILIILSVSIETDARKIRQSLKVNAQINKSETQFSKNKDKSTLTINVRDSDSTWVEINGKRSLFIRDSVRFSGYDKNISSSKESFHLINNSDLNIKGLTFKIIYLDMKGRMLHSRVITSYCDIPHGETRKIDVSTWDTQNSFYYYLSNEPKRVAAPYQVKISLIKLTIYSHLNPGK